MAVHLDEDTIKAINRIDNSLTNNNFIIDRFEVDTNGNGEQIIDIRLRKQLLEKEIK